MESNYDLLCTLIMLVAYSYTLIYAHILLARVDRKVKIGRHVSGEIRHPAIAAAKLNFKGPELTKALSLLRVNQVITYLFFVFLVFDLVARLDTSGINLPFFK
jgi:hypothetical protein